MAESSRNAVADNAAKDSYFLMHIVPTRRKGEGGEREREKERETEREREIWMDKESGRDKGKEWEGRKRIERGG